MIQILERFLSTTNDNKEFTLTSLHKKIAYVTQRIYIFNDTIAANVAYGEEIDEKRVIEALGESLCNGVYQQT